VMDVPVYRAIGAGQVVHHVVECAPRKSGLTRLQLALMGKGVVSGFRLRGRAEERVDFQALMQPGYGR